MEAIRKQYQLGFQMNGWENQQNQTNGCCSYSQPEKEEGRGGELQDQQQSGEYPPVPEYNMVKPLHHGQVLPCCLVATDGFCNFSDTRQAAEDTGGFHRQQQCLLVWASWQSLSEHQHTFVQQSN